MLSAHAIELYGFRKISMKCIGSFSKRNMQCVVILPLNDRLTCWLSNGTTVWPKDFSQTLWAE